jgi:sulfur carrier protein
MSDTLTPDIADAAGKPADGAFPAGGLAAGGAREPSPGPAGHAITLRVNGERRVFAAPLTCAGLIAALELTGRRVALERNGEIVPRSRHADTVLADADLVEIVVAVGGG